MADLGEFFDATQVEPSVGFELLPPGVYTVVIADSERFATKSGNGDCLKLVMEVIEGEYKNRKLYENLNLWNVKPNIQQMSRAILSAICRATEVMQIDSTEALHNRPMKVTVSKVESKYKDQETGRYVGTGEFVNKIVRYMHVSEKDNSPPAGNGNGNGNGGNTGTPVRNAAQGSVAGNARVPAGVGAGNGNGGGPKPPAPWSNRS